VPPDPVEKVRAEVEALKRESLEIGNRLLRDYPDDAASPNLLGTIYYRCGESAKAWQYWEQAWTRDPRRADACSGLASIAADKGEHEKVADLCRRGLEKSPGAADLRRQLAQALNHLGRPEEAVPELRRALEILPKDPASHLALGQSYALLGEYEKAKASYQAAVALEPRDQRAHFGLAMACAKLGLEDESQRAMQQYQTCETVFVQHTRSLRDVSYDAVRSRRCLAAACWEAAMVYLRHQEPARVEELLRRAAELDPQTAKYRLDLVKLLLGGKRAAEAGRVLKELVAAFPAQASFYALLADAQMEAKHWDEAIAAAQKASQLEPGNLTYRRMLQYLETRR
jgi:tetratricopeptide (TPR) repeat protein